MVSKSLFLIASVAQATEMLRLSGLHTTSLEDSTTPIPVNGTLTSFSILEGSGCPAGSYQTQPIEPGKSLNTYVDFDPEIFLYNSTTTLAPVKCTINVDFDLICPENGQADVYLAAITTNNAKFEEGDADRETNFNLYIDALYTAGDEYLDVSLKSGLARVRILT